MTCKTCKWAEWQRTATGRINQHKFGACTYPEIDAKKRPWCEKVSIHRTKIWPADGEGCPTYEKATA